MQFTIIPYEGVNEIKFGWSPEEVRKNMVSTPISFKKSAADPYPCDYFSNEGVFFYYDSTGHLEAIEFARPACLQLAGVDILDKEFDDAVAVLSALDSNIEKDADGAIAYGVGVGLYAPLAIDEGATLVESVIAFRKGYYDEN